MKQCEHWETEPVSGRDHYYWFPVDDDAEAGFLCDECAVKNGFCPSCGAFVIGSSDDYTMRDYGMCSECWDEVKSELDDDDWYSNSG